MSNPTENPKKSFFDLSQYSDRTRKIIFGIIVALLVAVVFVAMFIISPGASKNDENDVKPDSTATQAPVNPDTTVTPTANPLSPEEEAQQQQDEIIENGTNNPDQDEEIIDIEADVPDSAALLDTAIKGVLSYCVIAPGETTEQRKAKMAPYFNPQNSTYVNPTELYYERICTVEATTEPEINANGAAVIYVGVAWSAVLAESDEAASAGYTQYTVTVDGNGISSLDD